MLFGVGKWATIYGRNITFPLQSNNSDPQHRSPVAYVVEYIAAAPAGYDAPALVVEFNAPAPGLHPEPATVVEYIAPAPAGYAALSSTTQRVRQWRSIFTCIVAVVDVRSTVHYKVDDSQRHHFVAYQTTAGERLAHGVPKDMFKGAVSGVNTSVHEGRGLNMTLDAQSFRVGGPEESFFFLTITPRKSQRSTMLRLLVFLRGVTGAAHVSRLPSQTLTVTDLTHFQLRPRPYVACFFFFPCCEAPSGHRQCFLPRVPRH